MGPQDIKRKGSLTGSIAYDDNPHSNRQCKVASQKYSSPLMRTSDKIQKLEKNSPTTPYTESPVENESTYVKPDTGSAEKEPVSSAKRKRSGSELLNDAAPKMKRQKGSRKDTRRKAEITNQLANMGDMRTRESGLNSEKSAYTAEQYEHEKTELAEAKKILGAKYTCEGHEQDCGNELGLIEGMATSIRDYQTVGVAFMLRHERSMNKCRGGILADDMGIGKTIQSLACTIVNPRTKKAMSDSRGATLIIVPNQGLKDQWAAEMRRHGKILKKDICLYTGGGKMTATAVAVHRYVLATYSQVERDFRLFQNDNEDDEGPLFDVVFFRIILDEGDSIKNFLGSTSKACAALKAKLKWVLSGTPLRNSTKECLAYFRFLGINVNERLDHFAEKWGAPDKVDEHSRILQILGKRMLRREASQMYLGREICQLPRSHFEDRQIDLTEEEKAVSRHLELAMLRVEEEARERTKRGEEPLEVERAMDQEDAEEDEDGKVAEENDSNSETSKSNYRVRVTRLRQAVDHPFLLEKCIGVFMNEDELKRLLDELKEIKEPKDMVSSNSRASNESPCFQLGGPSMYEFVRETVLDMKYLIGDTISSRENDKAGGCLECHTVLADLQSLECGHIMCRACYEKHVCDSAKEDLGQVKCLKCNKVIATISNNQEHEKKQIFKKRQKPRNEVIQTCDGQAVSVTIPSRTNRRSPGDDFNRAEPRKMDSTSRWLRKCDESGETMISTKIRIAVQIIKGWLESAPGDQIVVFTEWIDTARILGRLLNKSNIKFVYYNGGLSDVQRAKNLEDFKKKGLGIQVLVSSMATGNVGLNITNANRMIIMSPWWNRAAEDQAFGRIKRHGQVKETHLVRLFARGTIDERLYTLQAVKRDEIRAAMSKGQTPKPLSSEEMRWLLTNQDAPDALAI
ncbi:hypothetical protein NPX13_g1515 [Xylaria arbuscula]|uniref:RING-type domain-containing protein n=1 Tax=Xylaria arbuscula TaxID=114810 RepID=A0A9W8TQ25_9PEZI|nr:hypothetical protein NPX13_g1515 [Xylaria arbuscula]